MILPTPKILMVDNYDSFTWNLVHYLGEAGAEVEVVRNDQMTADEAMARRPDGILLSPGPCDPDRAGICLDMVAAAARTGTPLLGVCLGHQTIGQAFGGHVVRGPKPMHGKVTAIHHHGGPLFDGLPETFPVTRYHSLVVERASLPAALVVTAEDDDGIIMGLSHRDLPIHGVQFHPESIASAHGHELIGNFLKTVRTSGTARATETA
ncbi:aminodeoxychorismate/anthranilate synthase component II [Tistrella mobilis]|uniref:anthranilate synthase component II n=1 Tax=Tistrella mobilis TaxID=171437 RepID=UPI000C0B7234|nr:aminodeoxychorismate/anthranilate synthase component II [uncultured Tistrella sp.]MAM75617.1 aminodeoxychorismate/anthranilate synthase component II [Tistrella sp.]